MRIAIWIIGYILLWLVVFGGAAGWFDRLFDWIERISKRKSKTLHLIALIMIYNAIVER